MNSDRQISRSLVFLITASIVTYVGLMLDYVLMRNGVGRFPVLLFSNASLAVAVAAAQWLNSLWRREKETALREKLETVIEMNLHVRNALTAIAFYGSQSGNPYGMKIVSESLGRIENSFQTVTARLIPERRAEYKRSQQGLLRNVLKFRSS